MFDCPISNKFSITTILLLWGLFTMCWIHQHLSFLDHPSQVCWPSFGSFVSFLKCTLFKQKLHFLTLIINNCFLSLFFTVAFLLDCLHPLLRPPSSILLKWLIHCYLCLLWRFYFLLDVFVFDLFNSFLIISHYWLHHCTVLAQGYMSLLLKVSVKLSIGTHEYNEKNGHGWHSM